MPLLLLPARGSCRNRSREKRARSGFARHVAGHSIHVSVGPTESGKVHDAFHLNISIYFVFLARWGAFGVFLWSHLLWRRLPPHAPFRCPVCSSVQISRRTRAGVIRVGHAFARSILSKQARVATRLRPRTAPFGATMNYAETMSSSLTLR